LLVDFYLGHFLATFEGYKKSISAWKISLFTTHSRNRRRLIKAVLHHVAFRRGNFLSGDDCKMLVEAGLEF
jgi:hypothetical protein